jgi:hypothetical protein
MVCVLNNTIVLLDLVQVSARCTVSLLLVTLSSHANDSSDGSVYNDGNCHGQFYVVAWQLKSDLLLVLFKHDLCMIRMLQ